MARPAHACTWPGRCRGWGVASCSSTTIRKAVSRPGSLAQPARSLDPSETVAAIHAGDEPFPEAVIRPSGFDRIDLVPGSRFAATFNIPDPHRAPYEEQVRLRDFLAPIRAGYDLVIIDCPPNLHAASWSAMAASDYLLVPVMPEDFGAQGTQDVAESAAMVRAVVNPESADARLSRLDVSDAAHGPSVVRRAAPRRARRRRLLDDDPGGRRLRRGDHRVAAGRLSQAQSAAAKTMRAVAEELLVRVATGRRRASRKGSRVMGKLDELLKHQGNMDASLGVGYARGITPPGMSLDHAQRLPFAVARRVEKQEHRRDPSSTKSRPIPTSLRRGVRRRRPRSVSHSLKTQGQLQPIRVRWDEASSSYIIIMGERRWCAAVQAQLETLLPASSTKVLPIRRALLALAARRERPPRRPPADRAGEGVSALDGGERLERQPSRAGNSGSINRASRGSFRCWILPEAVQPRSTPVRCRRARRPRSPSSPMPRSRSP